jgi:hypothetical protein
MTATQALAELTELDRFLVSAAHRQQLGVHICLAEQPETVNGSPEDLVVTAVADGALITGGWADELVAALEGKDSIAEISLAIRRAGDAFDLEPFARLAEEQILRGLMLGALDSQWERENDLEVAPARFRDEGKAPAVYAPFTRAIEVFEQKQVLSPLAFGKLQEAAKQKAFTVAGLAKQELLAAAHAELLKRIREGQKLEGGPNLRDFKRFAKERLESAGWTPANKSHVETIYRTQIVGAYQGGRVLEMSQPSVLAAMPFWQIRGVTDARQRATHRKAHGIVLPANHPFWRTAYPPFGFACRCKAVARTASYLKNNAITPGPVPTGLPDPGFESGTRALIQVPPQLLQRPAANVPVPVPVPAPPALAPVVRLPASLPPPPPAPPPLPPPRVPVQELDVLAKKVAEATGSNPGGVYVGSDGVKRYVKFYEDSAQAAGEHLANSIYRDLGLAGPESVLFVHEGKLAYASEILPEVKTLGSKLTPELAKKALDGFAADVLMANWDAAGLVLDNMLVDAKGRIIRIDNGAAFLTRAQGARKPLELLGRVTEWDTFFSVAKNPGYARLAAEAGITGPAGLAASIKRGVTKIEKLRDASGGWRAYVQARAQGLSIADREQIIGMLEARTTFLRRKVAELESAAVRPRTRKIAKLEAAPLPKERERAVVDLDHGEYQRKAAEKLQLLTDRERVAITEYTGGDYSRIRDAQFLTPEQWQDKWSRELKRALAPEEYFQARLTADQIEQSFTKLAGAVGVEAQVTEVFRGMRLPAEMVEELINARVVEWQAMTSSSWNPSVAEDFSRPYSSDQVGVVFVMRTMGSKTAGRRMAIEPVSAVHGEGEVLLQRGTQYRIVDVKADSDAERVLSNGQRRVIIYCEELAPGSRLPETVKLAA